MDEEMLICVPKELEYNISSTTFDPIEVKEEKFTDKTKDDLKFKKRLIAHVRKHGILYDNKNRNYRNVAEKQKTWIKIAAALATEANVCKNTWIDLRYDYQRYARRLRTFLQCGNNNRRRPVMAMETEMIFLWRFVADKSLYPLPTDENNENGENAASVIRAEPAQSHAEDDDIVLLEDDPIVVIDLDGDDDTSTKQNNSLSAHSNLLITNEVRRLVDLVKVYPELYNSKNRYYNDYKRKGIIWNAVANELGDKGTKLMKCWLHMQTRYEWELNSVKYSNNIGETELQKLLEFLSPHMHSNPNTVYKHAFYLKKSWQEPIEHFKNIFSLLAVMKKMPQIVTLTDELLHVETKNDQYFQLWHDVAKMRGTTMGICETTWLILRSFYWELMSMRKHSYQLQDKWYFESIITELYTLADAAKSKSLPSKEPISETPIVVNLDEDKIQSSKIETKQNQSLNSTTSMYSNVVINKPVKVPKIISAKSLAPSQVNMMASYSGTGLQITPITSPMAAAAAFNAAEPPSLSLGSSPSFSSNETNKNMVKIKLPYQLPQHTKVTAFTPSTTTAASTITTTATSGSNNFTIKPLVASISLNAATPKVAVAAPAPIPIAPAPAPTGGPTYKPILPKITGAASILNPNEIMIELIASQNGNQLVVHGPPLTEKYSISMGKTAKFIREVMAIPILHNKLNNQQAQATGYWHYLSKRFNLPIHICKAIWNFLSENFNHFPQIAPMDELMKPFKIGIKVWKESNVLFDSFHDLAAKQFRAYKQRLPELMQNIGFYFTFTKQKEQKQAVANFDPLIHWATIRAKFPTIDRYKMMEMWIAFKKVFWQYMCELERGIDNKWPQEWWHVLAKMKFLMELRYHNQEPFYYIVRNKIIEEIERCNLYEMKMNAKIEKVKKQCLLKAQQRHISNNVAPSPPPANSSVTYTAPSVPSTTPPPLVSILPEMPLASQIQSNAPKLQNRADIDAYALILSIRRHPEIYQRCRSAEKVKAWKDVAVELKTSISSCRLAFQRAVKNYRIYVARDPSNRCRINKKYFKHLSEIYRAVNSSHKLNIKTPTELNQSVDIAESNEVNFPERFILDINMDSAKPSLVMKNWAFGIGNISQSPDQVFEDKLRQLFNKFLSHINV